MLLDHHVPESRIMAVRAVVWSVAKAMATSSACLVGDIPGVVSRQQFRQHKILLRVAAMPLALLTLIVCFTEQVVGYRRQRQVVGDDVYRCVAPFQYMVTLRPHATC